MGARMLVISGAGVIMIGLVNREGLARMRSQLDNRVSPRRW